MLPALIDAYRFHRLRLHMTSADALRRARADVSRDIRRYPSPDTGMRGGRAFPAYGEACMTWFEHPDTYMRRVGFSDEIDRHIKHRGWYTDDEGDRETLRGVVFQLPANNNKPRYLYGYRDPHNEGAACLSLFIAADKMDAARWADQIAERAAELERDYNRAWQAGSRFATLGKDIVDTRRMCLALIAEARRACKTLQQHQLLKAAIRSKITAYVSTISHARKERAELIGAHGSEPGFNDF